MLGPLAELTVGGTNGVFSPISEGSMSAIAMGFASITYSNPNLASRADRYCGPVIYHPGCLPAGYASSYGQRTSSMVALARNLDLLGSRFLTGLTAVLVASFSHAPA